MQKSRGHRAPDDDHENGNRPNTFRSLGARTFQRSLLRRDDFSCEVFIELLAELFPLVPEPVPEDALFFGALDCVACSASHTPIACAHSPGIRRASQPINVRPAVRVLSGSFGSRNRTEMSLMSRARSVSLATPKTSERNCKRLIQKADGESSPIFYAVEFADLPFSASTYGTAKRQLKALKRGGMAQKLQMGSMRTSRSFAPFDGPTKPRRSIISTMRAARL